MCLGVSVLTMIVKHLLTYVSIVISNSIVIYLNMFAITLGCHISERLGVYLSVFDEIKKKHKIEIELLFGN